MLPGVDKKRLLRLCHPVHLDLSEVLTERGRVMRHVWFPVGSFISLIAEIDGHPGLEVGMVGREGVLGGSLALGVLSNPMRSVVQGPGTAWRVAAVPFRAEMARSASLRNVLGRYLFVRMEQLATSAACLRFHQIGPRLARWLMMSQDRAQTERFHLTHEFLAYMLGVRRVGITVAAGALQRSGLIRYHRGEITVLDRPGLAAAACPCYRADLKAYSDHLP